MTSSFIYCLIIFRLLPFCSMFCCPTISSTRHHSSGALFKGRFSPSRFILTKSFQRIIQQKFPEYHGHVFIHHHWGSYVLFTGSLLMWVRHTDVFWREVFKDGVDLFQWKLLNQCTRQNKFSLPGLLPCSCTCMLVSLPEQSKALVCTDMTLSLF